MKMIKMSLVAAVAVAGLSSNVAAKPLEEAIKNVDISGSIVYRYNDYSYDDRKNSDDEQGDDSDTTNFYKVATTLKAKVNDYVTATVRVIASNNADGSLTGLNAENEGDSNLDIKLSHANFTITTDAVTAIVGKQGLTTPWTVALDNDGNEQTGTGVLALIPAGPVTIAAAYFNQTNLGFTDYEGSNIATIGFMGQAGPVALDAWYLDLNNVLDTYTIGAKATFGPVTIDTRYTSLDDEINNTDNDLFKLKVSGKAGPVGLSATVGFTDNDGGLIALDDGAKTGIDFWSVGVNGKADAAIYGLHADIDVIDNLNVALNYNTVEYDVEGDNNADQSEFYTQITHKMGKNLVTYVRLGQFDKDEDKIDEDSFRGRLQVEYKF